VNTRRHALTLVAFATTVLLACGGDPAATPDTADSTDADATASAPAWHVVLRDLPAALLSVSGRGPDDLWLTGADPGDGGGAWLVHGTPGAFSRVDLRPADPDGGHLWWTTAPSADAVFTVGERGRAFRIDRPSLAVTRLPTGTDATLYGVWGATPELLWAVGGYVPPRTGPPTVVRITDGVGAPVTDLPPELPPDVTLFKVWGAAADDVWVVGERGTVLHFDGAGWTLTTLPGAPRLVTVHGASATDLVAVGGASQAVLLERGPDGAFRDASPGPYPLLNGVFVAPDGAAAAVGVLGQVLRRTGGVWTPEPALPLLADWHATWIDARGDVWIAGGNLLSAAAFDAGALLRLGPERVDLPAGPVPALDPVAPADPDPTDVAAPDALADAAPADDLGPVDTAAPAPPLTLGALDAGGAFTAFTDGQSVEIVQGPQGGIHLELALRFPAPGDADPIVVTLHAETHLDGAVVGTLDSPDYPAPRVAADLGQTYVLPVIFVTNDASPYVGATVSLTASLTLPSGAVLTGAATLHLRDDF